MKRILVSLAVLVLLGAGCGDARGPAAVDEPRADDDLPAADESPADDGAAEEGSGDQESDDEPDDPTPEPDDPAPIPAGPDPEPITDPEADPALDEPPDETAAVLEGIGEFVPTDDCSSDVVGLAVTAPEGWTCRALEVALGGLEGFTVVDEADQLNMTISTPSPIGAPCEILQACDTAMPIDLSDNFPDTMSFELAGTLAIWGTHASGAELVVTNRTALSDEQLDLVSAVLDSAVEI